MTKLLFCGECGDLVSPGFKNNDPRWCYCHRHAVWWRDANKGLISVHDSWMPQRNGGDGGQAWIVGLHNEVLRGRGLIANGPRALHENPADPMAITGWTKGNLVTDKEFVENVLAVTPDTYLFKRANSLVIRFAPGSTSDSQWDATVPVPGQANNEKPNNTTGSAADADGQSAGV
jgi:hypothetical protein